MTVYFDDIAVGETYVSSGRTVTEADISSFAGLSGDFNPLHTDEVWARANSPYDGRVAHGLLLLAIGSGLRTSGLDDWHVQAYLQVDRSMKAPARPGDTVRATFTVASLRPSASRPGSGIAVLDVTLVNERGETLQTGTDTLLVGGRDD
jgi:3-hydroxybutyryl-CoA dehydratase